MQQKHKFSRIPILNKKYENRVQFDKTGMVLSSINTDPDWKGELVLAM